MRIRLAMAAACAVLFGVIPSAPAQADEPRTPQPAVIRSLDIPAPGGVGFVAATNRIVVPGFSDGVAQIVDVAEWSSLGEIATNVPAQSLVQVHPETGLAYLAGREPIVSVIDTNSVSAGPQIPMTPNDVNATSTLISQADVPLLLVSFAPGVSPGAVALISTVTNFRRGTIELPYETTSMAIPQDRLLMLMADSASGRLLFLDTFFAPFGEVALGGTPSQILTSPDGGRAYVSNPTTGRIDIISIDDVALVGSIDVGVGVSQMALSPTGLSLAALITETNEIVSVDLTTASVTSRGSVGTEAVGLAYGNDDRIVYVADRGGNALLAVDLLHEFPSKPLRLKVKPSEGKARVSWKAPSVQGTAPVVRYRVTTLPKAGSCTSTKRSCTIQGLKPGKAYRFQVVAETEVGAGASAVSKPIRIPRG